MVSASSAMDSRPRQECIDKIVQITSSRIKERDRSINLQFQLLKQEILNEIQRITRNEINWIFQIINWVMPSLILVLGAFILKKIGG